MAHAGHGSGSDAGPFGPAGPAGPPGPFGFDAHRPPERELIDACTHCGFCLPTCPTYLLWGEEADSPRGRIVLMRAGLEGGELSGEVVQHFDRCLGCMACVTACPSGVRYDRLIEATRPQVERAAARSPAERRFRRLLFGLFPHPGRLRAVAPALAAYRRLGLDRPARRWTRRFPRLRALAELAPDVPVSAAWSRLPAFTPAVGPRRGRVGLLQGCVQRVVFSEVNRATARVLAAEGFDVLAPRAPRCCGALPLHAGEEPLARSLARRAIAALEGCEVVVTNAAGCGSAMQGYGRLLADEPGWAGRAADLASRVRDVAEVLAGVEPVAPRHPVPVRLAYHDACYLAHAQGVRSAPRELLRAVPGVELVEPAEWEICCGSAGVYNLLQPEAAAELGERKARNLLATGAEAIAAGNPGCALQIAAHLRRLGRPLAVHHPVEVLDASIRGVALRPGARR